MVLICLSLTVILSIFHVPLVICYVFFGKLLIQILCPFLIGCGFTVELCAFFIYIYIYWILATYQIYDVQIFSSFQFPFLFFCLFPLLCRSFLICNSIDYFCIYCLCFCVQIQGKSLSRPMSGSLLLVFLSKSFMVSGLTFKSLIHFWVGFFVYGVG